MVGIVIVSHSYRLAEGLVELAREMAGSNARIASAGGLSFPDHPLGTAPGLVVQAIEEVYSEDGVVVLMDLGSALLSAEMALEMLSPEKRDRVVLCGAPLVEGTVSASVQARLGSTLEQVVAEARSALTSKIQHLKADLQHQEVAPRIEDLDTNAQVLLIRIENPLGLHARPSARFVHVAGRFSRTTLMVRNVTANRGPVNAKSVNSVATLGLLCGHYMELRAKGPEAAAAIGALEALAKDNFGDSGAEFVQKSTAPPPEPGSIQGVQIDGKRGFYGLSGSPGIAIGHARFLEGKDLEIPCHAIEDPEREWALMLDGLEKARSRISDTLAGVARRSDRYAAEIFNAHLLTLDDEVLRGPAKRMIFEEKLNAAAAWYRATEMIAKEYQGLDNEYFRSRAADVYDVGRQVVRSIDGGPSPGTVLETPCILVASDLAPADTALLDPSMVLAICTASGAPTSHSAILARSLGIPAVVGLGSEVLDLAEGTLLVVDAGEGLVIPNPDGELLHRYENQLEVQQENSARSLTASVGPAVTLDGRRVEIGANVSSMAQAKAAVLSNAEGIGLMRTEFLFLDRQTAPDEEEQFAAYYGIARLMDGRPVIIRTLDVGGDKPLPYIDLGREANPFLGWRAIRVCLEKPEFFKEQLRAIVRVAASLPVKVMFPMVATIGEFRAASTFLGEALEEVRRRGIAVPEKIETGIMVEVPASALLADRFAREVDFFSIGSNDLTQYTMAAERGNSRVAALTNTLQPAVVELIRRVIEAAHERGKWVGLCGELGGDLKAIPFLVGLGIDELSMSPPSIPQAKELIRGLDFRSAHDLALEMLTQENPA